MIKEENLGRYFNNLRNILRYKLETLDYFEQVSRLQELEKKHFGDYFMKNLYFVLLEQYYIYRLIFGNF